MKLPDFIDELIPLPGCFLVFDDDDKPKSQNGGQAVFLDSSKYPEKAQAALDVFRKSKRNSISLLQEAILLNENGFYPRAAALAIMSYEELGKSQIAADYYTKLIPESIYKAAFRKHEKTAYTSRHRAIGNHEKVKHGFHIDKSIARELETMRQRALYVDENNNPIESFSQDDAELIISKVAEHQRAIEHAEELNCRIGSKALFK
ncbi:AbiV family abortive infection protein [Coraliomargarita sp. SDUM461003]|uniref:AbiV family abortive infection protein n=1 Tax=Thalassobacterium maritimum TaxID=3041265 RepID=A0ABU1B000_9BACT|nr:AbiV family abortive infection protein [Coraliomargarita sp. SDUM461003]MDQ8209661.1 AbiV family abortive infection protein [Coraliomargarita sp. SDUM461003]